LTADVDVTVYGLVSVTILAVTGLGVIDTSTTEATATDPDPMINAEAIATAIVPFASTPTRCGRGQQGRTKQRLSAGQRMHTRSPTVSSYRLLVDT
jgi:hypothetical protein